MEIGRLSFLGLSFATGTSVANVVTDVARKKALTGRDLFAALFAIKAISALGYGTVWGVRLLAGYGVEIRDSGPLFGWAPLSYSPGATFLAYLALDAALVAAANLLYFRALQVSPLSLCMPFIAFTPLFLIPTGYLMLRELPSTVKLIGVLLVVVGSLTMHRRLFAVGWLEPLKAIVRERGSRYMLLVAFIFSITNPLDAKLVRMSDAITQAFAYGVAIALVFGLLALGRQADWRAALRAAPVWITLAGLLECVVNLLQFSSHNYIAVVITISLKRAGIVLSVLLGWLIFKERGIADKLIAASVMAAGAMLFYLPLTLTQSLLLSLLAVAGMSAALYWTRGAASSLANAPAPTTDQ